jgi:hypothetical protein
MNGLRSIPLINGAEPSWANLKVNIAGLHETAITALTFSDEQVIENIYGSGQQPIARGYGNITPAASVTLLRSAVEGLRAASPTGRLQDIAPFDIIVSFLPINGAAVINHKIRNCQFLNDPLDMKQGDVKEEVTLDLLPSHIERN